MFIRRTNTRNSKTGAPRQEGVEEAHVRGVRPIERSVDELSDPQAAVMQGYCAAVRSAITDDGQAPLAASGLKLKQRLEKVADSLERVAGKGGLAAACALAGSDHRRPGANRSSVA